MNGEVDHYFWLLQIICFYIFPSARPVEEIHVVESVVDLVEELIVQRRHYLILGNVVFVY